jgi:ubiquinone/menaquinone biosynthesis C-methylase UbiE
MDFYKEAAEDFSRTRTVIWPGVLQFLNKIDSNSTILDAGCGNGKNMMKTSHNFIGLDTCQELLNIIKTKIKIKTKPNIIDLVCASVTDLPFNNQQFDAVMSIAVIHHIKNFADRVRAFEELIRVCKSGGKVLITVWQMENNQIYLDGIDIEILNETTENVTEFSGDKLIRWKRQDMKKGITIGEMFRFYHFYSEDEVKYMISYCEKKFGIRGSYFEERFNYYIRFDC